jgi:hypothetical protein
MSEEDRRTVEAEREPNFLLASSPRWSPPGPSTKL